MTTKAERKATRKQNRELRKTLRKERKIKFKAIVDAASIVNINFDPDAEEPKFADAFNQVWPLLKPILEYVEIARITGEGADRAIRTAIELGERISTGNASPGEQSAFIEKLDKIWNPVKTVLGIIVTFTNDKVDKIINDIIEIGDWMTQE